MLSVDGNSRWSIPRHGMQTFLAQFSITCNNYRSKLLSPRQRRLPPLLGEGARKTQTWQPRRGAGGGYAPAGGEKFTFLAGALGRLTCLYCGHHVSADRGYCNVSPNKTARFRKIHTLHATDTHRGARCPGGTVQAVRGRKIERAIYN